MNGPITDRLGRKRSINLAVVVFLIGSVIQCAAVNFSMLFIGMTGVRYCPVNTDLDTGRAIAGLAVGQLTMVVPLYISEVRATHSG